MTEAQTPPQIFNRALLARRRARAVRRQPVSFMMDRCIEDCVEKLLDINRRFDRALILAPAAASEKLVDAIPKTKRPTHKTRGYFTDNPAGLDLCVDEENLPFELQSFDLIISLLGLHAVNDLPGALIQFRHALRPDGVFMGAIFGGDTLTELRQAAYRADADCIGGVTPRVFPLPDFQQLAALLQRAGYALPVVDTDRVTVTYSDVGRLVSDLRDMGETNVLFNRSKAWVGRAYQSNLANALADDGSNSKFSVSFEILWMTGWAPHDSQQKPLKPGSAQVSLTQILNDKS